MKTPPGVLRTFNQVFSNVRMRSREERKAAEFVQPPKPKHWKSGVCSTWHIVEAHATQWDGKGGLVAVPRLRLGRRVG